MIQGTTKTKKQRTNSQNRSLHLMFTQLSTHLNELGLDAKTILKPSYSIWWTPEMIKRDLFCQFSREMFNKEHTSDLTTDEVGKVFDQIKYAIQEKFPEVDIYFPSQLETKEYLQSYERNK